jgi:hypothetical protein
MGETVRDYAAEIGMYPADGPPRETVNSWQPMTSAPRDGTLVLLGARLHEEEPAIVAGWFEPSPADLCWYDIYSGQFYPTHWMPLPEPPEATNA